MGYTIEEMGKVSPHTEAAVDWQGLVNRFDRPEVLALVLVGSYTSGDANPFSDVDLVRFTMAGAPALPGGGSYLIDGRLVVVSDVAPEEVEAAFVQPEIALSRIPGLRQARTHAFVWNAGMQAQADAYANREVELLEGVWTPASASLIKATVALIQEALGHTPTMPSRVDSTGR